MHLDPVVGERARGGGVIGGRDHEPARENPDGAFEDAHVYVHFKAVYTLALKQRLGKGERGNIIGAKKLFHSFDIGRKGMACRGRVTGV